MKIVVVANGLRYADDYPSPTQGGSVQTWNLCKELSSRGHNVSIIRRSPNRYQTESGVNLVGIDFLGIEDFVKFQSSIFHIGALHSRYRFSIRSLSDLIFLKPDILLLIDRVTAFSTMRLHIPKLYVIHSPDAMDFYRRASIRANPLNLILFKIKNSFEENVMKKSDGIVALNDTAKQHLRTQGYSQVCKIPNAVEIQDHTSITDNQFILYGGRFDWNKNVVSLVRQFSRVSAKISDYSLRLVGTGPKELELRKLIQSKGLNDIVSIHSWLSRESYLDLVRKCTLFVLPSRFESFPVSVIEAMSCGKLVIARRNIGTKEIIEHRKTGILYDRDIDLGHYLVEMLTDQNLRNELGRSARKEVLRKYTISKQADQYERIMKDIAGLA